MNRKNVSSTNIRSVGYDYPPDYVLRKRLFNPEYQDKPE